MFAVPQAADFASTPGQKLAGLIRTIEQEIIPRLVLAQRGAHEATASPESSVPPLDPEHITHLARLVLAHEAASASLYVEALHAQGNSAEALYLGLLAPTARRLGEYWTDDLCAFTDVTIGLCRLHQVLHDLGSAFHNETGYRGNGHRILLSSCPGEQHTFGLAMVADFFRRDGWDVWSTSGKSAEELGRLVQSKWFAVAGLSTSGEAQLDVLSASIRTIRRASCNPGMGMLVGGQLFAERPELAALVGADATAVDGRQAVAQARNLITLLMAV